MTSCRIFVVRATLNGILSPDDEESLSSGRHRTRPKSEQFSQSESFFLPLRRCHHHYTSAQRPAGGSEQSPQRLRGPAVSNELVCRTWAGRRWRRRRTPHSVESCQTGGGTGDDGVKILAPVTTADQLRPTVGVMRGRGRRKWEGAGESVSTKTAEDYQRNDEINDMEPENSGVRFNQPIANGSDEIKTMNGIHFTPGSDRYTWQIMKYDLPTRCFICEYCLKNRY